MGRPRKRKRWEDDGARVEGLSDGFEALGGGGSQHGEVLQPLLPHESGGMSLPDELLMGEFPFEFSDPLAWPFPDHDEPRDLQSLSDESQYSTSAINNQPRNPSHPTVPPLDIQITNAPPTHIQTRSPQVSTPHYTGVTSIPKCSCMPNLYTSLSSFQTLPAPSFPLTLSLLRNAISLARSVLHCRECIKTHVSAFQNIMLLCTLLSLVVHEFARLVTNIKHRGSKEGKIPLRIGEVKSAETMHLHTGRPDCPMGYNILLDGAEWSKMAREAVRDAVHGSEGESLEKLLGELIQRQNEWHTCPEAERRARGIPPLTDCMNFREGGDVSGFGGAGDAGGAGSREGEGEGYACLQIIDNIKRSVQRLEL